MQDLLPDYVSASLDATVAALVEQHLSTCDPCRDDIAVLRVARAVRPKAVTLDVAQIVANLPRPTPVLRLVRSSSEAAPIVASTTTSARSRPRRRWSASVWQVAAAVGVMIVGGTSMIVARNSPNSLTGVRSGDAQLAEAAESVLARTPGVSVSYGDLGDYSEAELQHMLDRLEKWDGTSSAEPLPTLPVVSTPGGSAP